MDDLPVAAQEPRLALDGGVGGTKLLDRALAQLVPILNPRGTALLEIDPEQGEHLADLAESLFDRVQVELKSDLAGLVRLMVITRG